MMTGRCFAAVPKSTVQTSPGCASILAKGFIPDFSLFGGRDQPIGICGDGKGHVLSKFHLGEEHVEGIAGFDSQAGEDFFGTLQAVGRHPGAEEGGRGHGSKVLVLVRDGKGNFCGAAAPIETLLEGDAPSALALPARSAAHSTYNPRATMPKSRTIQPKHRAVLRKHIVDGSKGAASRAQASQSAALQDERAHAAAPPAF
jgi:hypothetical protein